jgi:enoyl-CoA hydratase/carnithine racemase
VSTAPEDTSATGGTADPAAEGTTRVELSNVIYEVSDRIATVTLNRPDRLNALSHGPGSMHEDIATALTMADSSDDVRVVVITGVGRAFCSGGDMRGGGAPRTSAMDWLYFHEEEDVDNARIRDLHKPTIGAINGLCYGAGFIMAAHFDFLVAVESARFGMIESRMGNTSIAVFPYLVGAQWAKFLMLSGELISAQRAKEIGLVLEVFPEDRFQQKVRDLARRIAAMPHEAVILNKREVNGTLDMMGFRANKTFALSHNAVVDSMSDGAKAADGRVLRDVLKTDGFKAFKEARDAAFTEPWLDY